MLADSRIKVTQDIHFHDCEFLFLLVKFEH